MRDENQQLRQENQDLTAAAAQHSQEMAELSESEEYFRVLVEQVEDYAIFGMDPQGLISSWNVGAERIKGYRAAEILGQHLRVLYTPEERAQGEPEQHLAAAREHGHYRGEGWRLRQDGSLFWAEIVLTALHRRDGSLRGFSKVTRDATERRRQEQEQLRYTKELQRANQDLEQFAYAAAHDLQEPIRNIALYTQKLARLHPDAEPEVVELFGIVAEGSVRLQALVRDLFTYVQAIAEPEAEIPEADSQEVITEVQLHLHAALQEAQAHLCIGSLPRVRVYRAHFILLFQNLLANALKYCSARPVKVHLGAEREPNGWRFSVEDNGVGVPPEHRERIFQVFKRLHGREVPGNGIGLAICCRIVSHYGGRIWVEESPHGGARFCFTVPDGPGVS